VLRKSTRPRWASLLGAARKSHAQAAMHRESPPLFSVGMAKTSVTLRCADKSGRHVAPQEGEDIQRTVRKREEECSRKRGQATGRRTKGSQVELDGQPVDARSAHE